MANGQSLPRRAVLLSIIVASLVAVVAGLALIVTDESGSESSSPEVSGATVTTAGERPTTTSTTGSVTTTTVGAPRTFTIAATGELLLHEPVQRRAASYGGGSYSFAPMFEEVSPIIAAADLAICHMETPLSANNTSLSGYPIFNAPREIAADAAAAGYDACSTASNHTLDKGAAGVTSTLDVLDAAGLKHSGSARSALEAVSPRIYDANGVAVAHLSFTYGTNGIPLPADKPWSVNVTDPGRILADAAEARAGGAEFTIVSIQWGNEYQSSPTSEQQSLARTLLASPDIDLIVGSHVHVVQPIEKIGDEYVAYGVGNFLSNQGAPSTPTSSQDGLILQVEVTERPTGGFVATRVAFTPTWVQKPDYRITLASPETNPASYERTVSAVTSLGPGAFDGSPVFEPIG